MVQALKKKLKSEKGFTLIELLAVIVILGIIAAIAIPSVLGIIDNSKKDAYVANAQQLMSSAKMAVASDSALQTGTDYLTINYLVTKNYLDDFKSPDTEQYSEGTTALTDPGAAISYVEVTNGKIVKINLVTTKRGISKTGDPLTANDITRDDVK